MQADSDRVDQVAAANSEGIRLEAARWPGLRAQIALVRLPCVRCEP